MADFESPVDRAIREAAERGAFENLPGAGKPLSPTVPEQDDFLRRWAGAEEGGRSFLPMSLQLRKEAHDIPQRVAGERSEQRVRDLVEDLNRRISDEIRMPTSQPPLAMRRIDVQETVENWRTDRDRRAADRAAAIAAAAPPPAPPRRPWWRRSRTR